VVVDIPNAFVQTRVEDKKEQTIIRIRGDVISIFVKTAPEVYSEYVWLDKHGNKILIMRCLNALYQTMVEIFCTTRSLPKV
jgi:hypothetical protein